MDILIFDMDGVLLQAQGYHRALQETVRKTGEYLSLSDIELTLEDIYRFESLGISSEWQSSALCMAFLEIQLQSGTIPSNLALDDLFWALEDQPLHLPALQRGLAALEQISLRLDTNFDKIKARMAESENINKSLTMNWLQELVLGSAAYQERYQRQAHFNSPSYLEMYDIPLLSPDNAEWIAVLSETPGRGAAIMTNRPSAGPFDTAGSPEAEMGLKLIGLSKMPLIGYGEMSWLALNVSQDVEELLKPNQIHALAAIFSAVGIPAEDALRTALDDLSLLDQSVFDRLMEKTITVFEDTPAGVKAVQQAGELLRANGLEVTVTAIGIARDQVKIKALESIGATVFPDINTALSSLKDF
jgi:phosphoglycolate phosphatase-like HAD superfamily hydrolase